MSLPLTEKILRLHQGLAAAALPHAFGGALALAYCTFDPRATHDIDVNVFVGTQRVDEVLRALPSGVVAGDGERLLLGRDAQARLWWDGTPVDLFLANHPFHQESHRRCRSVPFAGIEDLPVLGCDDLAVYKAFFARPKDAVDLATMAADGQLDTTFVVGAVSELLGADHPNVAFVRAAVQPPDPSAS